ncbi:MAG: hypothetical protein KJ583_04050 [Nanoarchaeota archaeon]|nr:hypothetical protein [Nanoarchaeota archaeon]MBU1270129.1 hypothetical protein [Nanoarchaeota archaeon]MBU1604465.1 hypothetical protein [Nanoarchaeota archaeon]MBU2443474.1 hypothetical protein [Nanoarchaeota archaeon]
MDFENNNFVFSFGEKVGFLSAYLLFSTIIYFVLVFSKKIVFGSSFFYVILFTLLITLIGVMLRRWLR